MVVEQALANVKDLGPVIPGCPLGFEKVDEVLGVWLIRADVLGRVNGIELHSEQILTGRERLPVDVGEDDQSIPFPQPDQSFMRVGEDRPTPN